MLKRTISVMILIAALAGPGLSQEYPNQQANESRTDTDKRNEAAQPFNYFRITTYSNAMSSYCTRKSDDEQAKWRKKFICDSKITDAIIAFFTLFLTIFTARLVQVGIRQDKTARQHLRAFVTVDTGRILNVAAPIDLFPGYIPSGAEIIAPNVGPLVQMTIKNSGSTPAFDVLHWSGMYFAEFPLQSKLPPEHQQSSWRVALSLPGGLRPSR